MKKYICIHGHFYQPPRENPWIGLIEQQESAYPYHDWNERITVECYASNATSRMMNENNQITNIVNNYSKISFNFGPTLLSWLEMKFPEIYQAILQADQESQQRLSGHGNAIAQAYNHSILPLCNSRDKYTQILWGIRDFKFRFKREPQGLWLPETAVDLETLTILSELGIKFTILAQRQARRFRKFGADEWQNVYDGNLDPTVPYSVSLPNGRSIVIFFYEASVAQAVAFSAILNQGEIFCERILNIFSKNPLHPQLASIATDGETYGHHYPNGNLALTYALNFIENKKLAQISNFSYFLAKFPSQSEVEIFENSSWSCVHGIERWRADCGCNTSKQSSWRQHWRAPLRDAFDWLRDQIIPLYEKKAGLFFQDPWQARNDYIEIIMNHSRTALKEFFDRNAVRNLTEVEQNSALNLLQIQRYAMLMYTSCGWFFDEVSGLETTQIISYAAKTLQLAESAFDCSLEKEFCERLINAKSNLKDPADAKIIYDNITKKSRKQSLLPNTIHLTGKQRVVIENLQPEIDEGRFAAKYCINDLVKVTTTIFADGHDELNAVLQYRHVDDTDWQNQPLNACDNDVWQTEFRVKNLGEYIFTVYAWVDYFNSWRRDLLSWIETKQNISVALLSGAALIAAAAKRATPADAKRLQNYAQTVKYANEQQALTIITDPEFISLMNTYPDLENATFYDKKNTIIVDRIKARFSSWYEVFPRSLGQPQQHGSLQDLIKHLPYIAEMGFDTVYLPPIHPIGLTFRKGKNNAPIADSTEPGCPWAIGSSEGGHTAIHTQLGDFKDFQQLITKAKEYALEIAIDLALQCSPDHPFVDKHPQWFKKRPDGSIQYAENPPKKYQDIYPLNFQSDQWQALWEECLNIVLFWVNKGIKIFRVDNPHTKPFNFWQWLIASVKSQHPEVIFLSEAFTRPSIMYYLSKLGFSQSYTYFTWHNTKAQLTNYLTEITQTPISAYFRPNFWPNTPDILPQYLQTGGRPAFIIRLILAATLSSNFGIYGPAFELCENIPREPGSEGYLNSEKYEIKLWNLAQPENIKSIVTLINKIRNENKALQANDSLLFHKIDNEQLICYSKNTADKSNNILVVVNLDTHNTQSGWLDLALESFGISSNDGYVLLDLLDGAQYLWRGPHNYIELNPSKLPAHIFKIGENI